MRTESENNIPPITLGEVHEDGQMQFDFGELSEWIAENEDGEIVSELEI